MDRTKLIRHTRAQLLDLARAAGVRRRHRMTRAQLIDVLAGTVLTAAQNDLQDLPTAYGRTRLALLEVEPSLAHVFWEVTPEDAGRSETHAGPAGKAAWTLRLYRNGNGVEPLFDEEIVLSSGNWYVHLGPQHAVCFAELGVKTPEGDFLALCRSNSISSSQSSRAKPNWVRVVATASRKPAPPPAEQAEIQPSADPGEPVTGNRAFPAPSGESSYSWGTAGPRKI